jgi:prepilin-type N-terminal cleavage/methylation domain-containing protein
MTLTNSNMTRRRTTFRGLRARSGFSILEMLVVVVLVGIIMSVAGVRVSSMITQQKVVRAAGTIQTDMEMAFALAGRNRAPMTIRFATSASAIQLTVTDRGGTVFYRRNDLKALGLNNGDVTASSNVITVFPSGFASDTLSIEISVTKNSVNYKRRVRMSRAGMVKVI